MNSIIHPIADEIAADAAIELFLAGHDPLLFAADLGLTPEQVWDQIRVTLQIYIENSAAEIGRRGGSSTSDTKAEAARANGAKGGRPRKKKAGK